MKTQEEGVQDAIIGTEFAEYVLQEQIGEGGMGKVYKGYNTNLDRTAAVKIMLPEHQRHPELVNRFLSEARNLARVADDNAHIVSVHHVTNTPQPAMIMQFVPGVKLKDFVEKRSAGPIGPRVRLQLLEGLLKIVQALQHVHNSGIVHRDLKPENIMVKDPEETKQPFHMVLLDFGISKNVEVNMTVAAATFGTPSWSAPEQFLSAGDATPQADQFPIGLMAYQMLSPMFTHFYGDEVDKYTSVGFCVRVRDILQDSTDVEARFKLVPQFAVSFLRRCLQLDPKNRFADMHELEAELAKVIEEYKREIDTANKMVTAPTQAAITKPDQVQTKVERLQSGSSQSLPKVTAKPSLLKWMIGGALLICALLFYLFSGIGGKKKSGESKKSVPTKKPLAMVEGKKTPKTKPQTRVRPRPTHVRRAAPPLRPQKSEAEKAEEHCRKTLKLVGEKVPDNTNVSFCVRRKAGKLYRAGDVKKAFQYYTYLKAKFTYKKVTRGERRTIIRWYNLLKYKIEHELKKK